MMYFRIILICLSISQLSCDSVRKETWRMPAEFEKQDYIWLGWQENEFLGSAPFFTTIVAAAKEICPFVPVTIFYGPQADMDSAQLSARVRIALLAAGIDSTRIRLFYNEKAFGAFQDPGPVFLINDVGKLAVADFGFNHPDQLSDIIPANVARHLNLPLITSPLISEGGAWQTNGQGTMLLVESVELDRNKRITKSAVEAEYRRILGIRNFIWLPSGLKEEEWGKFSNGKYGIGTSGHVDEFCRFADTHTVLLAAVPADDTLHNEYSRESYHRMEANLAILKKSVAQDGKPFKIIRIPSGPVITQKLNYRALNEEEQSWFENVVSDSVEFYLTTGYMNFVIANEVVVTSRYWKEGMPESYLRRDEEAKKTLEQAFPGRKIVQIDCMPLHHDGAGLHCYSRSQPANF